MLLTIALSAVLAQTRLNVVKGSEMLPTLTRYGALTSEDNQNGNSDANSIINVSHHGTDRRAPKKKQIQRTLVYGLNEFP